MSSIKEFEHLRIPLESIKLATNNFGENNYISRGGFGKVYKGELVHSGIQVMVAVKRLDKALGQGAPEFWKEIMMLSRYRHEHLVSLLGFSDEGGENILVYEYLSNKSLDMYLSSTTLSWIQRLKICIGAARGLEYLHNPGGTTQRVLHRDIKSSNILLDENWKAKISDFGLSKFGPANQEYTFLISHAAGTFGYCDPLYVDTGYLTKESDIYSFGVVLFEVLCGRPCVVNYNDDRRFLSKLAERCYEEKKIDTIVHSGLQEEISPDCLDKFSTIAYRCLRRDRIERPPIVEIIKQLEIVLQDQLRYDSKKEKKLKSHEQLEEDVLVGDTSEEELKAYDDDHQLRDMAIEGGILESIVNLNSQEMVMLSKKAKSKTKKAATLIDERFNKISYPAPPLAVGDRSIGDFRNFESRVPTITHVMKLLLQDDTKQIISICGMGGSGKTTMVKEVARRVRGEKLFDEIIMAVVSKEHNLTRVQEDLAKWLGLRFKSPTFEGRANELWKRLLQSKKGNLVILDDVWKHIDLKNIGIPFGKEYKNCKVILTSRSKGACEAMGCEDVLIPDVLTPSEAWSLLGEMVGDNLQDDPDLCDTASEIAKRCGGLPIAIVCLGRALKDKRKEVWNDTLRKLQSSVVPTNIEGVQEEVYQSLQTSYDLLEDDESKKLFLLCCLYPEYANVSLEALVRCGFGLELFKHVDFIIQARDRVHTLTDKLRSRFLLLSGDRKSTVKVHSVVRSVGISVASRLWEPNTEPFSAAVIHGDRWPRGMKYEQYNAVSVVSHEISELPSRGLSFQKLELLQLACPNLSLEKLNTMFKMMKKVRVVELWNMSLASFSSILFSLPRDIFALCMDCKMENIGDIKTDEFVNLEILSLGNCDITELPMEIGKFANLKLLDMSGCRWLERISPGVISSLSQLEELDTGSKWWGDEEEGDASLTELESLTNLKYLGIRIKSPNFLPKKPLFEKLQRYVISVGVHLEKSRSFNKRMLLLKLEITDKHLGGGIEKLLRMNTEIVFLTGDGMKTALKELVPGGFQQVKNLTVECCNNEGTEYLSDYSYASNGAGVFTNLEKLHMEKMWHLRGILRHDGNGLPIRSFSRLRKINLSVLPVITYLFTQSVATNLVHLESLRVEYCTNMEQVIFNPKPSAVASTVENKIVFPKLSELILKDVVSLVCFSHGLNLQVEFPQLTVLKLEYLLNFHTFCPEEINQMNSKGNLKGTNFHSLVDHKVEFSRLAELTISKIGNIKEVWSGHLPIIVHLQGLYIQFCHMMEEVISIQRPSVTTSGETIIFLKLKEVILFGLNRLTFFCRGVEHVQFPQLRVLRLRWLTHFRTFCPDESTTGYTSSVFNDKVAFPSLETLELSELDNVEELWSSQLSTSQFGKLKSLRVEKCHRLINIFPSDLETLFPSLEKLEVEKCDSLEQVWGSKGVQIRNLKSVSVDECPQLRNLCSFYTFKGLSNLQILEVSNCKMMEEVVEDDEHKNANMKEIVSLDKLEEVKLAFLPNLNYFSHTKCDMEMEELSRVSVKNCPELHTFSGSSVTTPKLNYAVIDDVKSWLGDLNNTVRRWYHYKKSGF